MNNSTAISFKIADEKDFDIVVEMRVAYISEHLQESGLVNKELKKSTRDYLTRRFSDKSYLAFLGYNSGKVICCAGLLLDNRTESAGKIEYKMGNIVNLYVIPEQRGKGIGTAITEHIISYAEENGVEHLIFLPSV